MSKLFNKAIVCTDIHFGLKSNSEQHLNDCINFFKWMIEDTKKYNPDTFIFLGDFFHTKNNLNTLTLNYGHQAVELLHNAFPSVFIILGNHDIFYKTKRNVNTLVFTKSLEKVGFIDETVISDGVALIPWLQEDEWKTIPDLIKNCKYVFGHFELPHFLLNATIEHHDDGKLSVDMLKGPDYIFSGHFHRRQLKSNICYIGNCFPHDFSDVNEEDHRGYMLLEWDKQPQFFNWKDSPKYKMTTLQYALSNKEKYLLSNAYLRLYVSNHIKTEDLNFIKETLIKQYKLRDIVFLPQSEDIIRENNVEMTENIKNIDTFVITQMREQIVSKNMNVDKLIKMYQDL